MQEIRYKGLCSGCRFYKEDGGWGYCRYHLNPGMVTGRDFNTGEWRLLSGWSWAANCSYFQARKDDSQNTTSTG